MSVKKYMIRDCGYGPGGNSYFALKKQAVEKAKRCLISGEKRVVHIAKLESAELRKYKDIEYWELVNGTPKRTDNMRY